MSEGSDPDLDLWRAAWRYAGERAEAMARQVVHRLQRTPASGIFGDDFRYRTLWDEYCHERQQGPHPGLEYAWNATIGPYVGACIDNLSPGERDLLELAVSDHPGQIGDISGAVTNALERIAGNRDLTRIQTL